MIKSIQEYFRGRCYWREVTSQDETDFKETTITIEKKITIAIKDEFGEVTLPSKCETKVRKIFYNEKTREIAYEDPREVIFCDLGRFTFEKFYKAVFKGAIIGLIVSGAPTLAGYYIIKVKYGTLIGSALGAIKVYVDSTKGPTREIYCVNDPKLRIALGIENKLR